MAFNQYTEFADALIKLEMHKILANLTKEQKEKFVNSTRTYDQIASAICREQSQKNVLGRN
jgi:hypothetical protein